MLGQCVLYTNSAFKNFCGPTALALKVFTGSLRPAGNEARPMTAWAAGAGIAGGVGWGLAESEQGKWLKATVPEYHIRIADVYFAKCLNAFHT